eukprot:GFUD01064198.1.p1 GENE.GFUD01064198.1~~GFUD01064198.1.p1  ORF type:complete len:887 (+),score=170.61 GFUD01064198.1:94-2754(+)
MSVLGNGKLRSSFRKLRYGTENGGSTQDQEQKLQDCGIFYQTFTHHWVACRDRIHDYEPLSDRVSDDILTVAAQLEQMLQLLQLELGANNNSNHNTSPMSDSSPTETSILDMVLSDKDNILAQIVGWTKSIPYNQSDQLLVLEIQFCEVLLSCKRSGQTVLSHVKMLHPLLSLLDIINTLPQGHEPSVNLQSSLLGLVHTLCVLLMENPSLLDLFTCNDNPRFILFSLLTPYLHKPGQQGQQARDSLLLCISLSSRNSNVENYISDHSNFCPILATGLSGLFSSLPRSLGADSPSWHKLDPGDGQDIPGLTDMLTSIELCSAVIEVAPSNVASQLLELIHQGFLVPVIGPALVQETDLETIVSATAYVDLFLRKITAPPLLALWVKFILTSSVDKKDILETLINRINSSSQICIVTLALFETLVSFNMEDIMLSLVFRHLISCSFLLPSFRHTLYFSDPHGRAAYKFLSLVPVSCDPPATPLTPRRMSTSPRTTSPRTPQVFRRSPEHSLSPPGSLGPTSMSSQSYGVYLADAHNVIRYTHHDCLHWSHKYDGSDLCQVYKAPREQVKEKISIEIGRDPLEDSFECVDASLGPGSLGGESSGYLSGSWEEGESLGKEIVDVVLTPEEEREFWSAVGYQDGTSASRQKMSSVLARLQHEDRLSMSSLGQDSHGSEELISPRLSDALRPTGDPSDIPTLGPFLTIVLEKVSNFSMNNLGVNLRLTALVSKLASFSHPLLKAVLLHPDVVVQPACTTLIQAICAARLRIDSVMPGLLGAEEAVRNAREDLVSRIQPPNRTASNTSIISLPASLGDMSIRRSSTNLLKMFSSRRSKPSSPRSLTTTITVPPHTRHMAMAAVLLEEWLQELAALAQEHSVMQQEEIVLREK